MSQTEINKGVLVPDFRPVEEIAESVIEAISAWYKTKVEEFEDDPLDVGYTKLDGQWYRIKDLVTSSEKEDLCELREDDTGAIYFLTKHYNGGDHWTGVVEDGMEKLK